jgi:acetoin:2,6-dichlorophenolindophenol oxidoreductase subunit alpha
LILDGQDVLGVYHGVAEAVDRARAGEGPTLIEAKTYRFRDHAQFGGLTFPAYRSATEVESWLARDPIAVMAAHLRDAELLNEAEFEQLRDGVATDVNEAEQFAYDSPWPAPEALFEDFYA